MGRDIKCPVKGCLEKHLNMNEHFQREQGANEVKVPPVARMVQPSVANAVANEPKIIANEKIHVANGPKTNAERVRLWRKVHREEYNAKMREYRKRGKI